MSGSELGPWNRILSEKLILVLLVRKFCAFYKIKYFVTVFAKIGKSKPHARVLLF